MKKILLVPTLLILLSSIAMASVSFTVSNDDDSSVPNGTSPTVVGSTPFAKNGFRSSSLQVAMPFGQEGQYVCSGPAGASPSTAVYRANTMAGMFGVNVPTDRNTDPAAWYWIPTPDAAPLGLQWFDMVTTTFNGWKGATTLTNQLTSTQFNHRIVINTLGKFPVSAYTVTISSSLTNIAPVTFGIATNSSTGLEIQFNPQFVGEDWGPDGVRQSAYSVPQGRVVAAGDDKAFDGGQYPSATNYTAFARFGATVAITASSPAAMDEFRSQFVSTNNWIKVELKRNGVLVASNYVESALAKALISLTGNGSTITIGATGGQENSPYSMETRTNIVVGPWTPFMPGTVIYSGGTPSTFPKTWEEKRFFRLVAE